MLPVILCCIVSPLCAAAICVLSGPRLIQRLQGPLGLVAVGILLSLGLGHLLPEAMEAGDPENVGLAALICALLLCALEMMFYSRGAHEHHALANGGLGILTGSALHTFTDGIVIASAFSVNTQLGVGVTLAVLTHEVPHELGDFALMLHCGLKGKQPYVVNLVALLGTLTGGILGYALLNKLDNLVPYALALSGTSFIYVALSDLLPRLKQTDSTALIAKRMGLIVLGAALALILIGHE